mmetsp:Transcript_31385/g.89075  ORF Transcript_31385/g.89075 Transcript_31385/m.89075 type:complete len:251 (+) Transcript_31385:1001-1753(+)
MRGEDVLYARGGSQIHQPFSGNGLHPCAVVSAFLHQQGHKFGGGRHDVLVADVRAVCVEERPHVGHPTLQHVGDLVLEGAADGLGQLSQLVSGVGAHRQCALHQVLLHHLHPRFAELPVLGEQAVGHILAHELHQRLSSRGVCGTEWLGSRQVWGESGRCGRATRPLCLGGLIALWRSILQGLDGGAVKPVRSLALSRALVVRPVWLRLLIVASGVEDPALAGGRDAVFVRRNIRVKPSMHTAAHWAGVV